MSGPDLYESRAEFESEWSVWSEALSSFILSPVDSWTSGNMETFFRFQLYYELLKACIPVDRAAELLRLSAAFEGVELENEAAVTVECGGKNVRLVLVIEEAKDKSDDVAAWVYCFDEDKEEPGTVRYCTMKLFGTLPPLRVRVPFLVLCSLLCRETYECSRTET
jgi:hypothetical protein